MKAKDKTEATEHADSNHSSDEEHLQAIAKDIDRQMKKLAEMDTRVLIAREQLVDFQEVVRAKINSFQQKRSTQQAASQPDPLNAIREARKETKKFIKESKAINKAYGTLLEQLDKSRKASIRETRKAEAVLKEKFHEAESRLLKKAGEIKASLKKN